MDWQELAQVYKAVADPTRLCMLALLFEEGELCVCDFVETLGIPQSKASRHLRRLAEAGLVDGRRSGSWTHYGIVAVPEGDQATVLAAARDTLQGSRTDVLLDALARWRERKARAAAAAAAAASPVAAEGTTA